MKKSKAYLTIISILVVVGALCYLLIGSMKSKDDFNSNWSSNVTVSDGTADPKMIENHFTVSDKGEHSIELSWNLKGEDKDLSKASKKGGIGFVTGCIIRDMKGSILYSTSATAVFFDTKLELDEGEYVIEYHFFTNEEDYISFAKKYLYGEEVAKTKAEIIDFASFPENGTWQMDYEMKMGRTAFFAGRNLVLIISVLLAGSISLLFIVIFSKGKKAELAKYDERQELERGRGFKYGFFTELIYLAVMICLDWSGLIDHKNAAVFYATGIILAVIVYVLYCVWNESYFALNQNNKVIMITFVLIGLFNLVIGLGNLLGGRMIQNGKISASVLNLECAIMFLMLFATMLLKNIVDKRRGVSDDGDDE